MILACGLLPGPAARTQGTSGAILGAVSDASGGVLPDAQVTLLDLDRNAEYTARTDAIGSFRFPGLSIGNYRVTVEKRGFARYVQEPITLTLNQQAEVRVVLEVSAISETVVVSADAPPLNTTTVEVGVRFDERRISELPLSPNRNVLHLALSVAGVSQLAPGQQIFASGGVTFSVNGMRTRSNNFMIDGQDSNDPTVTGLTQIINNPDIVAEFRLITNQFSPEFGRNAGSIVNIVTKSGTNKLRGSAFWFHNDNHLNSRSNLDKALIEDRPRYESAPFRIEDQFGGTFGGPIARNRTFFFGSLQRWTDRYSGSGVSMKGAPTSEGRQLLQELAGDRPQVQALLKFLPPAQAATGDFLDLTVGGRSVRIPVGTLSGTSNILMNDWQASGRVDHRLADRHQLGGRYMFDDSLGAGDGQATPPGLANRSVTRRQAAALFLTSTLSPRVVNELRASFQRLGSSITAADPSAESIPSIEIPQMGMTGFNAALTRTAIGLAINLPQHRTTNTWQLQDTLSWVRGVHAFKLGFDLRRSQSKQFFFPTVRGLLRYPTLQRFVDDFAEAAGINKPLPGGQVWQYFKWDDYFFFAGDEWRARPSLTLTLGLRYEAPGNTIANLIPPNRRIVAAAGGDQRYALAPVPGRDWNNFQPRFGFNWAPRLRPAGLKGRLAGADKFVLRGGYSRTHDYTFLNIALNVSTSFPFLASINESNLQNAFAVLPSLQPPAADPNQLTRTIVGSDFRSPVADQFALEAQREFARNWVLRAGWIATKGTGLFQTIDANPAIPGTSGRERVDRSRGIVRLRANASSSIYHALQATLERRLDRGFAMAAHYTWSCFIDDASEIFNAATNGDVAVSQNSFNRRADRGRSTYDRPHRFSANFVYELPWFQEPAGAWGRLLGGWQVNSFVTAQSGPPFTPLNGFDPGGVLAGIDALVGNAVRPNVNTALDLSGMPLEAIWRAGGGALFSQTTREQLYGNTGRNILRGDGILNVDFGIIKNFRVREGQRLQLRAEFYNLANTRNFGIPESRVNSLNFANQWGTQGGHRRVVVALRYTF